MDEARRRTIRDRANNATPGPWVNGPYTLMAQGAKAIARMGNQDVYTAGAVEYPYHDEGEEYDPWDDPAFVAHAREDVPFLLQEIDELEGVIHDVLQDAGRVDQDQLPPVKLRRENDRLASLNRRLLGCVGELIKEVEFAGMVDGYKANRVVIEGACRLILDVARGEGDHG